MSTGRIVPAGVHNIKWILDKDDNVIGALHGTTYFSMIDIRRSPHVSYYYHIYLKRKRDERRQKVQRDDD